MTLDLAPNFTFFGGCLDTLFVSWLLESVSSFPRPTSKMWLRVLPHLSCVLPSQSDAGVDVLDNPRSCLCQPFIWLRLARYSGVMANSRLSLLFTAISFTTSRPLDDTDQAHHSLAPSDLRVSILAYRTDGSCYLRHRIYFLFGAHARKQKKTLVRLSELN